MSDLVTVTIAVHAYPVLPLHICTQGTVGDSVTGNPWKVITIRMK